jgi:hypothetical protein
MPKTLDLKTILERAKAETDRLPKSLSNRDLWLKVNSLTIRHTVEEPKDEKKEKPADQD